MSPHLCAPFPEMSMLSIISPCLGSKNEFGKVDIGIGEEHVAQWDDELKSLERGRRELDDDRSAFLSETLSQLTKLS